MKKGFETLDGKIDTVEKNITEEVKGMKEDIQEVKLELREVNKGFEKHGERITKLEEVV